MYTSFTLYIHMYTCLTLYIHVGIHIYTHRQIPPHPHIHNYNVYIIIYFFLFKMMTTYVAVL